MLKKNTLLKVDDAFIQKMSVTDSSYSNSPYNRTRWQRNSMMDSESQYDYDGYFKVILKQTEEGEERSISVIDGRDPENEYAGWAYYNATPVHCYVGIVSDITTGFLCLNINESSDVKYTIEEEIPPVPVIVKNEETGEITGGLDEEDPTVAKKVLAFITVDDESINIRQIFQHDIPELKVWGDCETEENTEGTEGAG